MKTRAILLVFLNATLLWADAESIPRSWGARSLALGGAYVAVADDASSPLWNPAGMTQVKRGDIQATIGETLLKSRPVPHPRLLLGSLSYVGVSTGIPGVMGLFWDHALQSDVQRQDAFGLSLARSLDLNPAWKDVSAGLSVKYLNHALLSGLRQDRSALGVDFALLAAPSPFLRAGAVGRNLNRPRLAASERLPAQLDIGLALFPATGTLLALDASSVGNSDLFQARVGIEKLVLDRALALRAGGNPDYISVGLGLNFSSARYWSFKGDYSFSSPLHSDKDDRLHSVSLALKWGAKPLVRPYSSASAYKDKAAKSSDEAKKPSGPGSFKQGLPMGSGEFMAQHTKYAFTVGPDDVLSITIKNHPELEIAQTVDSWGYIKLPFFGEIKIVGLTQSQLEDRIEELYSSMLIDPQASVSIRDQNSRVIYVLGAVRTPGKYSMKDKLVTVRDAVVNAGLLTEQAAALRVFIVRQTEAGPVYKHVNLYKILYRGQLKNNLALQAGDIVYVPTGFLESIANFLGRIFGPILGVGTAIFTGGASRGS